MQKFKENPCVGTDASTPLINSKLISELVSSDKTVFDCNNATQV